jgi:acetyltransferase-like isoleucine patch superfamily enzyme
MKSFLKKILERLHLLGFARFILLNFNLQKIKTIVQDFSGYLYNYWITKLPFHFLRVAYMRHVMGIRIGRDSFIHMGCFMSGNISIGDHSVIGRQCTLIGDIDIGNNVSITAETYIFTSSHLVNSPDFECFYTKVSIEDYAWIGARAMVLPGVAIGKGAVIGAASVVTKSISPFSISVGAPAREVGKRSQDLRYTIQYQPFFN